MNGRSLFLDVVSGNPEIVRYVQLFRMPLFLTRLDEEFKHYDDTDWENDEKAGEIVRNVMPGTLAQFGLPGEKAGQAVDECLAEYTKKKGE